MIEQFPVNIKDYIHLYYKGYPLNRVKPVKTQTDVLFRLSKYPIRIVNRVSTYENPRAYQKLKYFTLKNEWFYMIPVLTVKCTVVGFIIRGIFTNDYNTIGRTFSDFKVQVPFMFGFDKSFMKFDRYKKCPPVIVCEGAKDCLTLKQIYPFVLSNNTSSMGANAYVLRNMTNKFLLAYDNDSAGHEGIEKDKKILRSTGAFVDDITFPEGIKDCCDLFINPKTCEQRFVEFNLLKQQVTRKLKQLYLI